jgi:hypothetical protein
MIYDDKRTTRHVDMHNVPRHTLLSQNVDKNGVPNLMQTERNMGTFQSNELKRKNG